MQVLANNSLHHYYQKLSQVGRRDTADFKLVLCTSIYINNRTPPIRPCPGAYIPLSATIRKGVLQLDLLFLRSLFQRSYQEVIELSDAGNVSTLVW